MTLILRSFASFAALFDASSSEERSRSLSSEEVRIESEVERRDWDVVKAEEDVGRGNVKRCSKSTTERLNPHWTVASKL